MLIAYWDDNGLTICGESQVFNQDGYICDTDELLRELGYSREGDWVPSDHCVAACLSGLS